MKELDFDELDRAVNSLMNNVPKGKPVKKDEPADDSDDSTRTLTIDPILKDGDTPDFSNVGSQATSTESTPTPEPAAEAAASLPQPTEPKPSEALPEPATPEPAKTEEMPEAEATPSAVRSAPSLATKRSGRFMDVVHPSSDMKNATPIKPTSREGVTIEPAGQVQPGPVTPTIDAIKPSVPAGQPSMVTSSPAAEPAALKNEPVKSDWPDPLEMANQKANADGSSQAVAAAEPTTPAAPAPLTSPFLSGTKVEKRPLGGLSNADEQKLAEPDEPGRVPTASPAEGDPAATSDPDDQLPAEPNEPLPEELRSDLVAIESGGAQEAPKNTEPEQAPSVDAVEKSAETPEIKPVATPTEEPAEAEKPPTPATQPAVAPAPEPAKADSIPKGPVSINQQYKEAPSTGDQTTGAIYDTDAYHQPLKHPAKTSSGWMWVVWILLILLVGAGGGAALYFLGVM